MTVIRLIRKWYRVVRGALATTVMVAVAPTYFILHSGYRVVSIILPKKWSFKIDDYLWGTYQSLIVFCFEHMTGVEIIISGHIPKVKENVIFICNHQCTVDWVVTDMLAIRQNMIGNLRYVFKDSIKYMPLYGHVFGVHGGVFVKRDGSYNERNMRKVFSKLIDCKVDMYFVVFPEGTRFSTKRKELLAKSQAYAIENDLKPLNQVLTPRIKAFHCALASMKNYADAVYDATIVYSEKNDTTPVGQRPLAPNMWKFIVSESPRIHIRFDRIPIGEIPVSSQAATFSWLHSRFVRKDTLISRHFGLPREEESENVIAGVVTTPSDEVAFVEAREQLDCGTVSRVPIVKTLPSAVFLTGATAALLSHPTGRKIYVSALLGGTVYGLVYAKAFF